ncbi:MAG: threonine--tRNA ligase [bacterium]
MSDKIKIILPDGSLREYEKNTTLLEVAESLGGEVARAAIVGKVDGRVVDLSYPLSEDSRVEILTFDSPEGRDVYRHSTAHIMAHAVKELFPDAKVAIGPAIEDGFYYDFDVKNPFTSEDLERIEERMREIIDRDSPFIRIEKKKEEALKYFGERGEVYKVELIEEIEDSRVTLYQEDSFVDLCRGPHIPSTGYIKAFKLLSSAGAYWRGDERNPMLQRIYGTSFQDEESLRAHLELLEEAKRRDHRNLGKELDLFSVHNEAGAGLIHWHPKGARVRNIIENFWREEHRKRGYELVYTPHISKEELWKTSGHLENFAENMYSPIDIDGVKYILKPMNCNGHILIYKTKVRSYRDLPIRMAELGTVYRYERSGVLHGLLRVRGFTQDDAHIFCTQEQFKDEIVGVIELMDFMMKAFGFEYKVKLSTRPEEKYLGSIEVWERAESDLREALKIKGLEYTVDAGAGAFYGPKIDVELIDALGREWQGPTIQLDFNLPERFDVNYIDKDGRERRAVMIHRTVLGSMERFMGNLIEHYGGAFPVWLAPVQVRVIPITDSQNEFARKIEERLVKEGLRAEADCRNEKINYKIREAQVEQIPYMLIVGKREVESNRVAVRHRREGDLGTRNLEDFLDKIREDIASRK